MINLIRRDMATALGLGNRTPWELHLQVVGLHYRGIPSFLHNIRILDSKGVALTITAATVSWTSFSVPAAERCCPEE